jgi:hypothetical protein
MRAKLTINGNPAPTRLAAEGVVFIVLPTAVLSPAEPVIGEWELLLPPGAVEVLDQQGWVELEKGPFRITIGDPGELI